MRRALIPVLALASLASPRPAHAQLANAATLQAGLPASLALPTGGVATAEEPSSLTVNPAGVGFVRGATAQGFHEERSAGRSAGDGLYLAGGAGPLGAGLAVEWVRPGEGLGARYRKTTLALALTDGHAWSMAIGWNWLASPDRARDQLRSFDLGLTLRPWRHLSVGASAMGLQGRIDGDRLPARYAVGVASRIVDDTLTLSADLVGDDRARDDLHVDAASLGLAVETRFGFALGVQLLIPLHGPLHVPLHGGREPSTLLTLGWNGIHGGCTAGAVTRPGSTGWLAGFRASSEHYRGFTSGGEVPILDLAQEAGGGSSFIPLLSDRDRWLDLLRKLEQARDDKGVDGLVVRIGPMEIGRARAEELRARLSEVAARKPVLAWLSGGGMKEYLVASGATAIAVPPGGTVVFNGVAAEPLFFKDALARVGLAVDVVRVGAWKSAPEPLTRASASPEARQALDALLDDLVNHDVLQVSTARALPAERVRALLDRGLFTAEEAKGARLVDEVLWPDELQEWARRRIGRGVDLAQGYPLASERRALRWGDVDAIGVVIVQGTIVPGASRRDPLGSLLAGADSAAAALRRASDDPAVRAIVLRIDSGGGDGLASDLIWREVQQARKRKPVVVSMGDLAASGGYLAAVGADAIVAEPSTLTGSIGVFAMKPDLSGLLERLGVHREPHARGENALVSSAAKPWTPPERAAMQAQVDAFYSRFIERVAEGRKLSREAVEKVAQGRVWTGSQALERGLVDRLGSLSDALELARERAGMASGSDLEVRRIDAPGGLLQWVGAAASALGPDRALLDAAARVPELRALSLLGELGPVVALPP